MSTEGITTIISRSAIPEKVAEVMDRSADNKHQATTFVVQQHAEEKTKVVQNMDKVEHILAVHRKEEKEDKDSSKKRQKKDEKKKDDGTPFGKILDLKA